MQCQCKAIKCRACTPAGCKRAAVTVVDGVSVCQLCSPAYRVSTIAALEAPAVLEQAIAESRLCRMCNTRNSLLEGCCTNCGSIYLVTVLPQFVGVGCSVMRGSEHICAARSSTMAQRIAAALNDYKPNSRGK